MFKDPQTGEQKNGIKKVNYTHDALIDLILANPAADQRELAREFGYSESWICLIMASDSFQARFEERKGEMIDPVIRHSMDEQFKGLVLQSVQVLREKLEAQRDPALALNVMTNASKALGYGARVQVSGEVKHTHSLVSVLSALPPAPPRERPTLTLISEPEPAK